MTGGVYEKLGARIEEASSTGKNAEIDPLARRWRNAEEPAVAEQLQAFYDGVRRAVADAHTTPEKIDALAQGRV